MMGSNETGVLGCRLHFVLWCTAAVISCCGVLQQSFLAVVYCSSHFLLWCTAAVISCCGVLQQSFLLWCTAAFRQYGSTRINLP